MVPRFRILVQFVYLRELHDQLCLLLLILDQISLNLVKINMVMTLILQFE